jgi:hypothetical protein
MAIDPSKISSDLGAMSQDWLLLRSIMGGTREMRAQGETYLPKYDGESEATYENRLKRSVLTNYLEDAVRNAVALPFRKDVQIGENVPDDLRLLFKNVDLLGNDITQFSRIVADDGGLMGLGFILVDFSKNETDGTLKSETEAALRPYWTFIKADDVVACYTEVAGDREKVSHFRYKETVTRIDEEYKEVTVERIRVYKPGEYEVWEKDKGEWKMTDSGPMTITDEVPVIPVWCGRRIKGFQVRPLFLDLAYKQVEHWQSASDQRNILSFARFPMLAVSGVGTTLQDAEITVGPSRVLTTEQSDGKWYYVEPKGDAISAGRSDLEDLKEEMRILGLQPIVGKYQNVTATSRALDETRVYSAVQVLAMNLEDALIRAAAFTEKWLGREPTEDLEIKVNRDFNLSIRDTAEIDSLIRSRITGEISRRTFWDELKRRGTLSPEFDADQEQAQLDYEFQNGQIPFTVSAELPSVELTQSEKNANKGMDITNTFSEINNARNKAAKKGRTNFSSAEPPSPSKSANTSLLQTKIANTQGA